MNKEPFRIGKTIIMFLALMLCVVSSAQTKFNVLTPEDPVFKPLPDSLKGVIIDTVLTDSDIYPGTTRSLQVLVPAKYTGEQPACLLLGLDGAFFEALNVVDNLVHKGEVPVMIGVFVNWGKILDEEGNIVRYNRSNEYDRTDDRLAQFLEKEVLPLVNTLVTPDGRRVKISENPDDRAITGSSSSGIAAFNVVWERPDLFRRIYSSRGTFVAMRGGNELPAIIRKTEPKPIRIFLQDGINDTWNHIFGDWWEQNQLMDSALNFAGYEYDFKWDRGTHSGFFGKRAYPDALRWLWRGWPAKVRKGKTMNGMLQSILPEKGDEGWKCLGDMSDTTSLIPDMVKRSLSSDEARKTGLKNICSVSRMFNGDIYLSDSEGKLYLQKHGSRKPQKLETLPTGGVQFAVSPNKRILISTEKNSDWLISYIIAPDGTLKYGQQFYWLHNTDNHNHTPYGNMQFDTDGNLYVATPIGVQVCDHNGRVRAILPVPGRGVDFIAFSGNRLYAVSKGKIYVRTMKTTGHESWNEPIEYKAQGAG